MNYNDFFTDRKKRNGFTVTQQKEILKRQNYCCNACSESFTKTRKPNFDHIDSVKTNNDTNNGQALCAICHDNKTRKENSERAKKIRESKKDYGFNIKNIFGTNGRTNDYGFNSHDVFDI